MTFEFEDIFKPEEVLEAGLNSSGESRCVIVSAGDASVCVLVISDWIAEFLRQETIVKGKCFLTDASKLSSAKLDILYKDCSTAFSSSKSAEVILAGITLCSPLLSLQDSGKEVWKFVCSCIDDEIEDGIFIAPSSAWIEKELSLSPITQINQWRTYII